MFLEVKDELERLMYDVKRTGNSVRTNLKGMLMCEILIMIKNCHFCIYKNPIYNYFLEYVCQAMLYYKCISLCCSTQLLDDVFVINAE